MDDERFTDDQIRTIIARALEADEGSSDFTSSGALREIAAELGISSQALDRAFLSYQEELRPAPRLASRWRRWAPFLTVVTACALLTGGGIATLGEIAVPGTVIGVFATLAALLPLYDHRRRSTTIIAADGVRYIARTGRKLLPWSSVAELKVGPPGTVTLKGPHEAVLIVLRDFGDPNTVLAAIKVHLARNAGGGTATLDPAR